MDWEAWGQALAQAIEKLDAALTRCGQTMADDVETWLREHTDH